MTKYLARVASGHHSADNVKIISAKLAAAKWRAAHQAWLLT